MPTLKELVDCMPAFVESSQTLQATLGGEKVGFKKGDHLVLICVHEVKKLRAEDEKDPNITYFLPLTSKKTFERLPTDPRLDDHVYKHVLEIVMSDPYPNLLRVIEEYYSDDHHVAVYEDDVIEVTGLETDNFGKFTLQRFRYRVGLCTLYVIGVNQAGVSMRLPDNECTAHFSTMPSAKPVHCSELAKLKLPQRVRVPPEEGKIVRRKDRQYLCLAELEVRKHILATSPKQPNVLFSITIESPIDFVLLAPKAGPGHGHSKDILAALKPLFSAINFTVDSVVELGYPALPEGWEGIPQPLDSVMKEWTSCYEAISVARELNNLDVSKLENEIVIVKQELEDYQDQMHRLGKESEIIYMRPPMPPPRSRSGESAPPPARPPKPAIGRKSSPSTIASIYEEDSIAGVYEEIPDDYMKGKRREEEMQAEFQRLQRALAEKEKECQRLAEQNKMAFQSNKSTYEKLIPSQQGTAAMSINDVKKLLLKINLGEYTKIFEEEQIDGEILSSLTKAMLVKDLHMKEFHAVKLLAKLGKGP